MNFHVGDAISPSTMMAAGGCVGREEGGEDGKTGGIVEAVARPRLLLLAGGGMEFCIWLMRNGIRG